MYYGKKLCKHLKKSFSLFLAFSIMLSVCAVSGISLNVSAATDSGKYYLITTANSDWHNKTLFYRIYDSSGKSLDNGSVLPSASADTYSFPSKNNDGALIEVSLAGFDLPTTAVKTGYTRIFLDSNNVKSKDGTYNYTNPYVHYYSGSNVSQTGTTWPGVKMTRVSSVSNIYYVDIPQGYKKLNFCDWNDSSKQATHQTTDQNITYYGEYAYYSGGRWQNPRIRSIDISGATSSQDAIYMDADENLILSKFSFDGNGVDKKPIYVYNTNWQSSDKIYVTYSLIGESPVDYYKTYTVTTELEKDNVNGYVMFKGTIPVDTYVCFHINKDNLNARSNVTTYVSGSSYSSGYDENTATYKITSNSQGWIKRSEVNSVNYDAIISNTFANNPNIVGVDATYFDYWSDNEQSYGYLNNESYNSGIENYWYQFDNYNAYISNIAKNNSSKWLYPLYFGNMFKGDEWYNTFKNHANSLTNINNYDDNYYYAVNNSNGMEWGGGNYNQSLLGLVYNKLDSDGDLQIVNGVKAPYFDTNTLVSANYGGKRVANVYKSSFPFRTQTDADGVTKYSFTSKNATDNIYFTWDNTTPKQINYGSGEYYGVKDKLSKFGGTVDGYGVFPFNTNSNTKTTNVYSKTPTSNDGEFYIRTDSSAYYLWLFEGGSSDKQIKITNSVTYDGVKYLVVNKSDYAGYTKCIIKPNENNWNNKSNNLVVSNLVSYGAITTSGSKYNGEVKSSYSRGGNDELDYGFGIRLDIDFRVPANGKLANGEDVKFNFSGDDDLWVYIGEDSTGADAELVLDLGGDHKEASGNINFATMKATADDVFANYSSGGSTGISVPSDEIWVKYQSYTDFVIGVWNYGSNNPVAYIQPKNDSTASADGYYKFSKSSLSGYTYARFCKWQNYTDGSLSSGGLVIADMYGKCYTPTGSVYTGGSKDTNIGKVETSFNGGIHLDSNKTYHMVVFYMERGESESNLSIDFTMTPANNNLTVNKTLDTADTVTEIANDLSANEVYDYTITDGTDAQGKAYELNGADAVLGSNGAFTLQDKGVAEFDNTFDTGSDITVNESISSPLSYTTNWNLVNRKNGSIIMSSTESTDKTAEFILKDYDDESASALLDLDYVNKIKTSQLSLTKKTVDEEGNPYTTDQQFAFKLMLDLDGAGAKYSEKAYPVKYKVGGSIYTATQEGIITVGAGETVEIVGLPVGATYTIYEQTASGFLPLSISNGVVDQPFNGTYSDVIGDSNNQLVVTNKLNPVKSGITVNKTLDGQAYTGSKFSYTLNGLPQMTTSYIDEGNYVDTFDTASTNITVMNVTNGSVAFENMVFDKVGYYRYYITESYNPSASNEEKAVYNIDNRIFLVEVSVVANGSDLIVNEPTYSVVAADKAQDFLNAATNDKNSFFTNSLSEATFENTTNKASIAVNKSGQADENIADTTFALIKVSAENAFESSDLSSVIADIKANPERAMTYKTDASGNVKFSNILVYQDGSGYYTKADNSVVWNNSSAKNYVNGEQEKQVYCLFEYSPSAGYNPNGVINYYTFPIYNNETSKYQFDVTASYIDGVIVAPNASGSGISIFFKIGFVIIGLGALLVLSYTVYDSIERNKRRIRYNISKN